VEDDTKKIDRKTHGWGGARDGPAGSRGGGGGGGAKWGKAQKKTRRGHLMNGRLLRVLRTRERDSSGAEPARTGNTRGAGAVGDKRPKGGVACRRKAERQARVGDRRKRRI